MTKNSEHEDPGSEAGEGIDDAGDDGITVAVVVELVVRPQCWESSRANTVGKEYLGCPVYPRCPLGEVGPVRGYIVEQSLHGSI